MKILHITAVSSLIPKNGVSVVLKSLIEEQNNVPNIESRLLSLRASIKDINSQFYDQLCNISFVEYIQNYKPTLVIFHTFFYIEYIKCSEVLWKLNIPYVIEPHGTFGKQAMKKSFLKKTIACYSIFYKMIKNACGYIYTNEAEWKNSCFKKAKIAVIPNGVDLSLISNDKEKYVSQIKQPIFYFLGRFDIHHKGLDCLFEALSIIDNKRFPLTFKVYGVGNHKQTDFIDSYIQRYKYINVSNMGVIYGEFKKKALEEANICVLTSRYEGSPMTILDALVYGNPCVVTDGTNMSEELESNGIGWRTGMDPNSIARTIIMAYEDYMTNPSEFVKKCKNHVIAHYDWKNIAEKSINEYQIFIH